MFASDIKIPKPTIINLDDLKIYYSLRELSKSTGVAYSTLHSRLKTLSEKNLYTWELADEAGYFYRDKIYPMYLEQHKSQAPWLYEDKE